MEYPSEGWHVMVTSYDGQFTGMTAMNIETHGSTWTLWLTDWLSDETIFMIEGIVKAWQDEVSALVPASDIHPKMKYETTITV